MIDENEVKELWSKLRHIYIYNTCNSDPELKYEYKWELGYETIITLLGKPSYGEKIEIFGVPVIVDVMHPNKIKLWQALN